MDVFLQAHHEKGYYRNLRKGSEALFAQVRASEKFCFLSFACGGHATRAGDLGRVRACEITKIEGGDFIFNHTIGKTVREGDSSLIIVPEQEGK